MTTAEIIKKTIEQGTKNFEPSGCTSELYLDIIEKVIDGYGKNYIEAVLDGKEPQMVCIVFRLAGGLSYLIKHGRKSDWFDLWCGLMDISCKMLLEPYENKGEFDLALQELVLAMKLLGSKVTPERYKKWHEALSQIDPFSLYGCHMRETEEQPTVNNITVYGMAGEFLRKSEGMTTDDEYFKKHLDWLLERFDENGMYVDPDRAILYDLTTRVRIAIMLHFGYDGKGAKYLDDCLKMSGQMTLCMQSSQFQLPYGGRSNPIIFNECLVASCCEYEAARYQREGNIELAGMYKRCAKKSAQSILRWLDQTPPRHYKNLFDINKGFGTDGYGSFHRYLIPAACFMGYALLFSDDEIDEYICPNEVGGYVIQTSDYFHKVIATCADHTIEVELCADRLHDSNGCGRFHKKDVPIELGLSMPFTAEHKYNLPDEITPKNLSLGAGFRVTDGSILYIADMFDQVTPKVEIISESQKQVSFSVKYIMPAHMGQYRFPSCMQLTETYQIDDTGVTIDVAEVGMANPEIFYTVPILRYNGEQKTIIEQTENSIKVRLGKNCYTVTADLKIEIDDTKYANRNGIYNLVKLSTKAKKMRIHLNLE